MKNDEPISSQISMPHDRFFRSAMSDQRVAKAFFEEHLPNTLRSRIDLNQLNQKKDTFVDENLRASLTDVLFSIPFEGQESYYMF